GALAGVVSGALSLKGKGINPEILKITSQLKLTADEVTLKEKNHPMNFKLDASLQINKGILDLTELQAKVKETSLTAKGTYNFKAKALLSVLSISVPDLNQILAPFQIQGVAGECQIAAKLSGSPQQPNANLLIKGRNLAYKNRQLSNLQLTATLIDKKIEIKQLQADFSAQEKILGSGWITPDRQFAFNLVSDGIFLRTIDPQKKLGIAKGRLFLKANGHGSIDNPQITGKAGLNQMWLNEKALDDFNLSFTLNNHQAKIKGFLNFDLNGFYNLKTKNFKAALLFQDTDLAAYLAAAGRKELSGRLTGKIEAAGNADQLEGIKAKADLSDIKLFLNNKPLLDSNSFKANFQNKTFSISQGKFSFLQNGWLTLSGAGKLQGPLTLSLDGLIPLKAAYLFIKKPDDKEIDELEGNLHISATLRGRLLQPEIRAVIELENVGMLIPVIEQQLESINGTILLTPRQLEIKKPISGQMAEGRFELTGSLELAKWQPQKADFLLSAHKIPIEVPDLLDLVFNTSLSIKGTRDNSEVKGEVVLLNGTYYKDVKFNLLKGVGQKKRTFKPPFQNYDQSILNNLKLDIALKSRSPFKVENNLVDLSLSPDLHFTGTLKRPLIRGRARVNSGRITYLKKDFIVRKGVLDFVNPYKLNPELDILSEVNVRTWEIYLKVSGTPEDLLLTLRSDPPEEDEDVLSLLLFGKTSQELIAEEGKISQSTPQLLAELIEGTLGEDIKKIVGIDILEVETTDGVEEEEFDPDRVEVTVGKKLSRRLTVKYAVESKNDELNQRAISEYQFFDQIFVNGFQDDRGIYGGGLILRIEFR
nr:translocation/assembly module TamB domain-containing protein [Desulfobacterales bacterium]